MKSQTGNFLPYLLFLIVMIIVAGGAYYLGSENNKALPQAQTPIVQNTNQQETKDEITVKVEDGDIVVTKNGINKVITDWGYNSVATLSPDKTKIAYLSKTEQSFENEKKYQGYVPGSTNVWIINIDGSNPIKATDHKNWIYRDNLLWLSDNKLLFTEGTSSVKTYDLSSKTFETVLGPETPEGVCVDACGSETHFIFSPNKKYLVLLSSGIGGVIVPPENQILNTQTLSTAHINQKFEGINYDNVSFDNDFMFIDAMEKYDQPSKRFSIDLASGKVSHL